MRAALAVGLLAVLLAAAAAHAQEGPSPALHELSLGAGVPIPLRVYGGPASLHDSGLDLVLVLHVRAAYTTRPFCAIEPLRLGARASVSVIGVTDGELSLWGWVAMLGPHLGAAFPVRLWLPGTVAFGAGPALARSGFRFDQELHRAFWAAAMFAFAQLSAQLTPDWAVGLDVALEHVLAAPEDQAFFNQRLGSTTLLALSLGVTYRL